MKYLKGMASWSPKAKVHYINPETKEPICGTKPKSNQYYEAKFQSVDCRSCLNKKLRKK